MRADASGWETRITDEMIERYTRSGEWSGKTLHAYALERARDVPDRVVVVDGSVQMTFAQLFEQAVRVAIELRHRGLRPGDVISFQLPNWHEAMVINLAASIGGLVSNPIIPIYRDAEVGFILKQVRSKVLVVPQSFRGTDYVAMIERLRPGLPDLREVVLVRASVEGYANFEGWLDRGDIDPFAAAASFPAVDPNAVKLLLYTSGTTADPKGVLHSHNTVRAQTDTMIRFLSLTGRDVVFMATPVTHITGYLFALEQPLVGNFKVVLMDRWNAAEGVKLMAQHNVSFTVGATPFLVESVVEVERQAISLPSLRMYASGGAPVPPEIIARARVVLPNCITYRAYGSSEAQSVSFGIAPGDPVELGATTDGFIQGYEVRFVEATTPAPLAPAHDGEILLRGPQLMLGYTNPQYTEEAFDADGFFHTGDLGYLSHGNYLTINGRSRDLIIRGGENISPKEIEDVLHRHPSILEAAVVAMPHDRMGETPSAYVVLRPGMALDFAGMVAFLEEERVARQKFPEKLFVVEELPHTASGKVLKHVLRARGADYVKAHADGSYPAIDRQTPGNGV